MRILQATGKLQTNNSGTGTISWTAGANFKPGTTVLLGVNAFPAGSTSPTTSATIGGTAGTRDVSKQETAQLNNAEIWRASNVTGGVNTLTLVSPGGATSYYTGGAIELLGILASPFDQSGTGGQSTSAAPSATAAGATAQDDELALAVFTDYAGTNWTSSTPPSGYTEVYEETNGTAAEAGSFAYKLLSAIGTETATFATGASMSWIAALGTYKVYGPGHNIGVVKQGVGGTSSISTGSWDSAATPGMILVGVGRGVVADHGSGSVTDNKSNTYTWRTIDAATSHVYGTDWPTSGTAIYACASPTGGSGHTVTAARTTSGDETTIVAVEVPAGFTSIVDEQWVYANSGANTSDSVTTTGAAWLYCFWWGADTDGENNPVPDSGWYKLEYTSDLTSNHVQVGVFAKYEASAGTYTCGVTPGTAQKAQMYLLAVQASGGGGGGTINAATIIPQLNRRKTGRFF